MSNYKIVKANGAISGILTNNPSDAIFKAVGSKLPQHQRQAFALALKNSGSVTLPDGTIIVRESRSNKFDKSSDKLSLTHPITIVIYLFGAFVVIKELL